MKIIILINIKLIKNVFLGGNCSGHELFGKNQYCSTDLIVLSFSFVLSTFLSSLILLCSFFPSIFVLFLVSSSWFSLSFLSRSLYLSLISYSVLFIPPLYFCLVSYIFFLFYLSFLSRSFYLSLISYSALFIPPLYFCLVSYIFFLFLSFFFVSFFIPFFNLLLCSIHSSPLFLSCFLYLLPVFLSLSFFFPSFYPSLISCSALSSFPYKR